MLLLSAFVIGIVVSRWGWALLQAAVVPAILVIHGIAVALGFQSQYLPARMEIPGVRSE